MAEVFTSFATGPAQQGNRKALREQQDPGSNRRGHCDSEPPWLKGQNCGGVVGAAGVAPPTFS